MKERKIDKEMINLEARKWGKAGRREASKWRKHGRKKKKGGKQTKDAHEKMEMGNENGSNKMGNEQMRKQKNEKKN